MPARPTVEPLPRAHRRFVFWSFLAVFLIAMPALWFYTTGYRFDWNSKERSIVGVGGLYISTDSPDVEFYVDEVQVTKFRIFRQASYIQDLTEGVHKVHVQGEGLQTWTKDLPVHSHIVTEAFAFTLPQVPHIRVIGAYTTATGTQVLRVAATSTSLFDFASTTNSVTATTSKATSTLIVNSEYDYISNLFAQPATTTSLIERLSDRVERQFVPSATTTTATTTTATTTKEWRNVKIYTDAQGEVQASWIGGERERPHYYCVPDVDASTTSLWLGTHVYLDMVEETIEKTTASTSEEAETVLAGERVCRESIRIDNKGQKVRWFDFYPESTDLILMLLEDGLYVVEVDDRAWQNTQLLYPGDNLEAVLEGGRIYVKDRGQYLEVFTTITR